MAVAGVKGRGKEVHGVAVYVEQMPARLGETQLSFYKSEL